MRRPQPPRRGGTAASLALVALLLASRATPVSGQVERPPEPGGAKITLPASGPLPPPPRSLGQPPSVRITWGPLAGYEFDRARATARLNFDFEGSILGSGLWWLGGTAEAAARMTGRSPGGAVGTLVGIPWLSAGPEYRFPEHDLSFTLSMRFPLRRGGLFRHGDMLRVDYRAAQRELVAGLTFPSPFERYRVSRPMATTVRLPSARIPPAGAPAALPPETERQLAEIQHSILWMSRLLTPHFEPGDFPGSAARYRDHIRQAGHTFEGEETRYHGAIDSAFASVLTGSVPSGRKIAALAESVLFRDVIVPFDRTFGQERVPVDAGGFCAGAFEAFRDRIAREALAGVSNEDSCRASCVEVFRRILPAIRDASRESAERWREPFLLWSNRGSLGWLPLDYGLRPDQYDAQDEWDAVLAAVTGASFTDSNTIHYLMMEQFHLQLKRMIRETRSYQVTIVHDFRGRTRDGESDLYGWDIAVDGYVAAFVKAIRELDRGERDRLPQFFLLLDANYYQASRSREIMTFLENLVRPVRARFPHESIRDQVLAAQDTLLDAIRSSRALAHATPQALREAFRVHVSVTNPFDPSFMLDVTRRDHRKVAFRDVTEEDPGSGEAVYTGQGIGEHYNGTGWEDRALLVRGPALVQLKSATRDLLAGQGFSEKEIPQCLRPLPFPPNYGERCIKLHTNGWTVPVSILDNETGFGAKNASVLKAAIYNLAPRGSFILSYDSLWSSEFWAGMFVGMALRGANAIPIGPVPANAPSAARPTLHYLRQTLRMMVEARSYFSQELARSGGMIRVGLYAQDVPTSDFRLRVEAFQKTRAKYPFLREITPIHPSADTVLAKFRDRFVVLPLVALRFRPRPLLHMKCQMFATAEAFQVMGLREWTPVLEQHIEIRGRETSGIGSPGVSPKVLDARDPTSGRCLVEALEARLDSIWPGAKERVIFTFTIGSHNQNPRSLLLDGEDLVAVSGTQSLITMIDMTFVLCISEWPADVEEFDRLFHEVGLPFYLKPLNRVIQDQG